MSYFHYGPRILDGNMIQILKLPTVVLAGVAQPGGGGQVRLWPDQS